MSDVKGAVLNLAQRNTSVLIGANVVTLVIRLFSTIILTRLLEPAAFGTIAIIGTVQTVLVIASDVGFYPYVVRDSRVAETRFLDQMWTLRLIRALILGGITLAIARPTALYVGVPDLELALQITALQPIVEGLSSMAFATAARGGEIKKLSMLDLIIALTQAVLSILLSIIWRDFWGMVIAATACSFLKTFLSYYLFSESRRRWNYSYEQSKQLWSFGRHILPSSMIS
ncbi:MAG: oligosaccharide flippase family protein, partial [Chakrabartia sp.]